MLKKRFRKPPAKPEFIKEVLNEVHKGELSAREVGILYDIDPSVIYKWKAKALKGKLGAGIRGGRPKKDIVTPKAIIQEEPVKTTPKQNVWIHTGAPVASAEETQVRIDLEAAKTEIKRLYCIIGKMTASSQE